MKKKILPFMLTLFVFGLCLAGCGKLSLGEPEFDPTQEIPVIIIPLTGDVTDRLAEVSGLAWYGDTLIILPQYPERFPTKQGGSLFAIPKDVILAFLDGKSTDPLRPQVIPFMDASIAESITDFDGFEAIGFGGETAFLTIEAKTESTMSGLLVSGKIDPNLSVLQLDVDPIREIQLQADLANYSDEAILLLEEQLITFYEANGANVNPQPVGHVFDLALNPLGGLPFPTIEYRLTDVTAPDEQGRFWGINYLFSGDEEKLDPAVDQIAARYGVGPSHTQSEHVERLVEFQYTGDGIVLTDRHPLQLELRADGNARNWEGIVRLDERGFLLMTDKHPGTMLGFVAIP